MEILFLLVPLSILMAAFGLLAFLWASHTGQFDDLRGPPESLAGEDDNAG